ncbi:MAG: hypothetical protein PHX04_02125 [Bacilli bacterium]|nr:hypothetical protein [Bacilli bacterium]
MYQKRLWFSFVSVIVIALGIIISSYTLFYGCQNYTHEITLPDNKNNIH